MDYIQLLKDTLYFLAILNPPSKILFLSAYQPPLSFKDNLKLSRTSSLVAMVILLLTALIGNFVLKDIFRIDLYSLKICGGIILFFTGLAAIRTGHFVLDENHQIKDFSEISIIPLAAPLIAGPGTIAIGMTIASVSGICYAFCVIFLATTLNFIFMMFANPISTGLRKAHMSGPAIRMTGLIVATMAIQFILSGIGEWWISLAK